MISYDVLMVWIDIEQVDNIMKGPLISVYTSILLNYFFIKVMGSGWSSLGFSLPQFCLLQLAYLISYLA